MTRTQQEWLNVGQASEVLGVAQGTVREWSDAGRIPVFYTPGGHRRFKRADLEGFTRRNGAGSRARRTASVLVIDDDAKLREIVRAHLEYDGMGVREAADGEAALRATEAGAPDLVLLNAQVRGIDPTAILRALHGRYGTDSVAVLLYTAPGDGSTNHSFDPIALVDQAKSLLRVRITS